MDPIGLVREVGRFSSSLNVEPYNDNHVRAGVCQINRLFAEAALASKLQEATTDRLDTFRSTIDSNDFKFLLMQNEIMRIKRCLLTYHKSRLDHLARMSKELPTFPANVRSQLSKSENSFQTEYAASLGRMSQSYGNVVNLTGPLNPPKDLYVTVRVVKDCGTVQTEFGPLYLNANSFHFVRKADSGPVMIINGRMVFVFIKRKGGGGATPSKMNKSTFLTGAYWYHFADYSGAAGGYVMDMPSQFQSSPAKNRIGGNLSSQSLKPMTIKQLNEAIMPHPDSPYQVDGHDLTQVSLVACVRTLKEQSNGSDYLLEDGTGTICGHVWANERNSSFDWTKNIREGEWVKVYGNLKTMSSNRFINIIGLHKIEDGNELTHHFLSAINLHLINTGRAVASKLVAGMVAPAVSTHTADKSLTPIQQAVYEAYAQSKSDVGVHINSIFQAYRGRYPESDIRATVNWLMNEGYLYQTIDNEHAKSTE